jgi:riboflavin kinase / FMN adenylyltransferase
MPSDSKRFTVVRDGLRQPPGPLRGAVVAIGNFEGVHRGHRVVIDQAVTLARALGRPAAVLTFEPHPRAFFRPDEPVFRLSDESAKLRLLAATELDGAIILRFDAHLAGLAADDFVDQVLCRQLAIAGAVIGFDFHFGRARKGTPEFLTAEGARRGFAVAIVPEVSERGAVSGEAATGSLSENATNKNPPRRFSSGAVRNALAEGNVADAAELLGYPWFVSGEVRRGDARGRELGFPTANLQLDPGCRLRHGIYAVRVNVGGQRYGGVASFGRRPTFDNGAVLLEVFLFDFAGDLYGHKIDVAFLGWIRPELKFDSVADLVRRMQEDADEARVLLAKAGDAFPPLGTLD